MHLFSPGPEQKVGGITKLGTAYDGIVHQNDTFIFNQFMHRNQLHLGNQVPLALDGRHERTGPGGRVFDQRTGERNAAFIGIPYRMGDAGIRNAGHIIRRVRFDVIPPRHILAAVVPHLFHGNAFVEG